MTATPNLPPLPSAFRHFPSVERDLMRKYGAACNAAGRDAGLEEAANIAERQECPYASHDVSSCHAWDMASVEAGKAIRALKSKEPV